MQQRPMFHLAMRVRLTPAYTYAGNVIVWRLYAEKARVTYTSCSPSCECMGVGHLDTSVR